MKKYLLAFLLSFSLITPISAEQATRYFNYGVMSEVNASNLNGNFNNIIKVINGGIDNINLVDGFRLIEILGSLPIAEIPGRGVYLTTEDILYLDDGTNWWGTATYQGAPAQGEILHFNGTNWVRLGVGTLGNTLMTGGAGADVSWASLNLAGGANYITGVLPIANGGTGTTIGPPRFSTKIIAANDSISAGGADYTCDGTADDVQIQQAIDALDTAGVGGRVMLLEGTYNIDATITIAAGDEDLILQGQGWGTILKAKVNLNADVILCTADRITIRDMYVENSTNAQATVGSCIEFNGADHCLLENVKISGRMAGNGIPLLLDNCDYCKITKNTIILSTLGIIKEAILQMRTASKYNIIANNIIDGSACTVNETTGIGGDVDLSGFSYCVISNNYIIGDGVDFDYGIYLGDNAEFDSNAIIGNVIYNCHVDGIHIKGNTATENLIDGNMARDGVTDNGTSSVIGDNNAA